MSEVLGASQGRLVELVARLNVRGRLYRAVMRLSHRYGWHYAPKKVMPMPDTSAPGTWMCWCQWCGMRDTVYSPTIEQALMNLKAIAAQGPRQAPSTPSTEGER